MFYDGLLLFSVLFFATAVVLPLNEGKAISTDNLVYPVYLLAISFVYFGWCWTHGGQTLGMRAWRVRALAWGGATVNWKQAWLRFAAALLSWLAFGVGFLWAIIDPNNHAWHDRLSNSELVLVIKEVPSPSRERAG